MTPAQLRAAAASWVTQGQAAMLVRIERAQGSVPREVGAGMVVSANDVIGTLGGGHLELQAIRRARALLADGTEPASQLAQAPVLDRYALGPSLGQCCGGVLVLRTETLTPTSLADWAVPAPRFVLWLYGAGHVGRAIVRLLIDIDCEVCWIDGRPSEWAQAARELPGLEAARHIRRVCAVDPVDEVAEAPDGAAHLVMTHRHDLDLQIAAAVLRREGVHSLGVIGSETKAARFRTRLLTQHGIVPAKLERLTCPIGLPGVRGKEPAVIAVSVVAQLLHQTVAQPHRVKA